MQSFDAFPIARPIATERHHVADDIVTQALAGRAASRFAIVAAPSDVQKTAAQVRAALAPLKPAKPRGGRVPCFIVELTGRVGRTWVLSKIPAVSEAAALRCFLRRFPGVRRVEVLDCNRGRAIKSRIVSR